MLTVPKLTASVVADHYGLDARAFRRWMRRNANVRLLGALDSPAMNHTVERFKLCAPLSDAQVRTAYVADPSNVALDNEFRGRGLMRDQPLTDEELVAAYVRDAASNSFGVNYTLAQEMQSRRLLNPRTAELTRKGARIAASL